ncbi:hypothetical protein DY000_02032836 [Brassica cretica]|uniref:Uncharacterized protein n=1 Tax=Brassica cretica TaxID=69181 RepID=A0ABQ7DKP2_BRACR|nr:hypothetical protein DY000_02032836 [Brassica cretica]
MHGKELLKQGLVKKIGNGAETNVWRDNWLLDLEPRPPSYRPDAPVDLTLLVSDLINPHLGGWDVRRVRQVIAIEDVDRVLKTKIELSKEDSLRWGFSNNGQQGCVGSFHSINFPMVALANLESKEPLLL